ncbi:hypothetical protein BpHYR1_031159 [Brachionus plicatilis]|uniref:Ubiquitin-like protease family profile domain-containing protein n=1 Tax=Brachionus plicatilis TaxID=10195 RepID=A0A3M7P5N9_BRAPC|nr:hypothetical protein BpHYR1_031159 [Brachionus plicatilis]
MIAGLVYDPLRHHWCLFFVDVKNQSFSFLDSLGAENDNIYFEKWKKFVHPLQNDGVSCGVFVCMFFESLLNVDVRDNELKIKEKCPYRFRKKI